MVHAKFEDHRTSGSEIQFVNVLAIYAHDNHTRGSYGQDHAPLPRRLHIKFGFNWSSSFQIRCLKINGHIHVYSRTGADKPWFQLCFQKH